MSDYEFDDSMIRHEKILKTAAITCLLTGVIYSVIFFFSNAVLWKYDYNESIRGIDTLNWGETIISCSILLSAIVSWSMINLVVGISRNVRTIKDLK